MTPLDSARHEATQRYTETRTQALQVLVGTHSTASEKRVAKAHMKAITRHYETITSKLDKAKGDE